MREHDRDGPRGNRREEGWVGVARSGAGMDREGSAAVHGGEIGCEWAGAGDEVGVGETDISGNGYQGSGLRKHVSGADVNSKGNQRTPTRKTGDKMRVFSRGVEARACHQSTPAFSPSELRH